MIKSVNLRALEAYNAKLLVDWVEETLSQQLEDPDVDMWSKVLTLAKKDLKHRQEQLINPTEEEIPDETLN